MVQVKLSADALKPTSLEIMATKDGGYIVLHPHNPQFTIRPLFAGALGAALEFIAKQFMPEHEVVPVMKRHVDLTDDALKEARKPRDVVYVERNEMDSVLDDCRATGMMAGVQVVSQHQVVAWVGDIQKAFTAHSWLAWGEHQAAPIFYKAYGLNAIEDAAKWLRAHRDADLAAARVRHD